MQAGDALNINLTLTDAVRLSVESITNGSTSDDYNYAANDDFSVFYCNRTNVAELNNSVWNDARLLALRTVANTLRTSGTPEVGCSDEKAREVLSCTANELLGGNTSEVSDLHKPCGTQMSFNSSSDESGCRNNCTVIKECTYSIGKSKGLRILDLSDNLTLTPIRYLAHCDADEICIKRDANEELYKKLTQSNRVCSQRLEISNSGSVEEFGPGWNIIMHDLVETSGCLKQHVLEDIALARCIYYNIHK